MPSSPYWTPSKSLTGHTFRGERCCILRRARHLRGRAPVGQFEVCRFSTRGHIDRKPLCNKELKFSGDGAETQSACQLSPRREGHWQNASVEMTKRAAHLDPAASTSVCGTSCALHHTVCTRQIATTTEFCAARHRPPKAVRSDGSLGVGLTPPRVRRISSHVDQPTSFSQRLARKAGTGSLAPSGSLRRVAVAPKLRFWTARCALHSLI